MKLKCKTFASKSLETKELSKKTERNANLERKFDKPQAQANLTFSLDLLGQIYPRTSDYQTLE